MKRKHSKSQRDVDLEDQLADQRKTIHRMRDKLRKIDELENNDHNLRKRISMYQVTIRNKSRELLERKSRNDVLLAEQEKLMDEVRKWKHTALQKTQGMKKFANNIDLL